MIKNTFENLDDKHARGNTAIATGNFGQNKQLGTHTGDTNRPQIGGYSAINPDIFKKLLCILLILQMLVGPLQRHLPGLGG